MTPSAYDTRLVTSERCGPGTLIARFEKPAGYDFAPGQFMFLTLATREGEQTKHFTHCQAPGDGYLEMTTRLTGSAFKDALAALQPGDPVRFAGPGGSLTLPGGTGKVAFLTGGVGITPARSIVRDAFQRGTGLRVLLFYGNQDETCVPFRDEFAGYEDTGLLTAVHVLVAPSEAWAGERGFITADLVRRHADPLDGWHWIVSGPPAMITAMQQVVSELAIPRERVSYELFSGYE